jgi:hypothetical protein
MKVNSRLRVPVVALLGLLFFGVSLLGAGRAVAQDLGHRIPGVLGIDAGVQGPPGLSVLYRLVYYQAGTLRDRNGDRVPIRGLDLDALANALGLSLTLKPRGGPYLTAAFAAPLAHISVNSNSPRVGIDRFGFSDLFFQPLKVGWRLPHLDLVTAYAVYVPTGRFSLSGNGSVGSGAWTHQFALGGAVFLDQLRQRRGSVLANYFISQRKRGVDIRRGDILQFQGGASLLVVGPVTAGVAGYALWQTTDDSGSDLPRILRGARDRVFGLGPEVIVLVPALRLRAEARYEWDFGARSRPQGSILVVGLTVLAWQPRPAGRP